MDNNHSHKDVKKKLGLSILLNLLITCVQAIGGLVSGSLSLITDALHNLTDTFSLVTSFIALKLSDKENTELRTFGYKRAEILAALLNASLLIVVSFFLFKEAVFRFFHPVPINSGFVIVIATLGLVANSLCAFLLKSHSHDNMNIRSAFVHLLSDALVSVAVIIGAICMYFFGLFWVDSVLTLVIGLYVIREGYVIVMDAVHILMQNVPKGIVLKDIQKDIEKIMGVKDIHHAHVWCVTVEDVHFEAHINTVSDIKLSESCVIKAGIEKVLKEKYSINHATLQFEYDSCQGVSLVKNKGIENEVH
ncbi:MAG: cation diffusion facilitator family transporter [Candidatus Omnitrophica bacterium]|nr:cation diffusion facilitator family transporter [Candidatus Omnitrophota bacterium]MBU1997132.1 cation diffusion facilitator family transporter [Candidatus Omnitrophota bacterium]MBU4333918.1 cation diffusion facilitator family transporter [Candidatus Omnitrophota bacterium]